MPLIPEKVCRKFWNGCTVNSGKTVPLILEFPIQKALAVKNAGSELKKKDWELVSRYVTKDKCGVWTIDPRALHTRAYTVGCFAIRTDCIADAKEALEIYRRRNIVEAAFRQFKESNGGSRLYATETAYIGKLFVHTLAQSFAMAIWRKTQVSQTDKLRIPGNSIPMLMDQLKKIRAVRGETQLNWVREPVTKKARDALELLGLKEPPKKFKEI